jgi:ATP-binding cassette, subfamily B, bacterial
MQNVVNPIKRFIELIALEKKEIISIYFYAAISGLIYLSLPLGIQSIINLLFGGIISTSLFILVIAVAIGVGINGWLQIIRMQVNERIQKRIFTRYSLEFAYKIPRLDLISVDNYHLPELVNRFFDIASLQKGLSKVLLEFPSAFIQIIFGIILLSLYSHVFIIFGIILLGLIFLILRFTYPKGMSTSLTESKYKYEVGHWLEEVARTIKSIKFMGRSNFPAQKADQLISGYLDAREEHFKILKIQYWAFVAFKTLTTIALLLVGCFLVIDEKINIGQFIATEIIIITILSSVEKVIDSLDAIYDMLTSLEKVSHIMDKPNERISGININEVSSNKGLSIKADHLSYRFKSGEKYNLHNLNFEINSGEKVCIFGTEGSGKSTLLKLFTGAYPQYEGQLLINNYPISNYNLELLRNEIGISMASDDIFSGTLRDNLILGNENISNQRIIEVAQETGLLSFIQSIKDGLQHTINSSGKQLPRNIINKILVTRALLASPKLVLIEDCWSSLERNEQEKMVSLLTNKNNIFTLIGVSNDPNFAANCDKIILLDEGEILDFGAFKDVAKNNNYTKLFKQLSL